ncbi:MAG: aldo/keto reductase [Paludibaculum sp.]
MLAAPGAPAPAAVRTLGKTGLKVTSVGFGCMVTSDPTVIERAVDLGITYFDTARVYSGGNDEHMVGATLKANRQKLVLSSKTLARDKEGALRDIDTTLKELGTGSHRYLVSAREGQGGTDHPGPAGSAADREETGQDPVCRVEPAQRPRQRSFRRRSRPQRSKVILTTYNFAMAATMEPLVKSISDAGIGVVAMKVMAGSMPLDRSYDFDRAKAAMAKPGAALSGSEMGAADALRAYGDPRRRRRAWCPRGTQADTPAAARHLALRPGRPGSSRPRPRRWHPGRTRAALRAAARRPAWRPWCC